MGLEEGDAEMGTKFIKEKKVTFKGKYRRAFFVPLSSFFPSLEKGYTYLLIPDVIGGWRPVFSFHLK